MKVAIESDIMKIHKAFLILFSEVSTNSFPSETSAVLIMENCTVKEICENIIKPT